MSAADAKYVDNSLGNVKCERVAGLTDGAASYTLAIAAKRERAVRDGILPPRNDAERRQADEGPRGWSALDCVREARRG